MVRPSSPRSLSGLAEERGLGDLNVADQHGGRFPSPDSRRTVLSMPVVAAAYVAIVHVVKLTFDYFRGCKEVGCHLLSPLVLLLFFR